MTGAPENRLKTALKAGQVQCGMWVASTSPIIAELCGHIGFDWCLVDMEHSPNDAMSMAAQLQALASTPTQAVVRVIASQDWLIKQALDAGAQTILVPLVNTADEAARVAAAMRYAPEGTRGMGAALARASQFSMRSDYVATTNAQVCCLVQAETREALENLEAIVATDGVDGVFIGPADLSADMGYPGQPDHPEVVFAINEAIATITKAGKIAGTLNFDPDKVPALRDQGVTFLGVGAETITLVQGLTALRNAVR
ncbi:MAG: HpcH/HpaI aldolase/citrate lyase family protein [Pseudomonadota bacterium]